MSTEHSGAAQQMRHATEACLAWRSDDIDAARRSLAEIPEEARDVALMSVAVHLASGFDQAVGSGRDGLEELRLHYLGREHFGDD